MTTTSHALTAYAAALAAYADARDAYAAAGALDQGEISNAAYYRAQDAAAEARDACRLAAIDASIGEREHSDNMRKA